MPRPRRLAPAGVVQHVCNRGSRKGFLFDSAADYIAFIHLLAEARSTRPMRILAYCLMRNHWHLLLWPEEEDHLSPFMHWLTTTHARQWRDSSGTQGEGAVYQSRFTAVPILDSWQYFIAWRYIERNALEAGLVGRAESWPWCSAAIAPPADGALTVDTPPLALPADWLTVLNTASEIDLEVM